MDSDLCRDLENSDPVISARAHIALLFAATPRLAELRFRAGPFQGAMAREAASIASDDDVPVLAETLGLSFHGCDDHGLLAPTTLSPACDGGEPVVGVEGAECAALDHACGRGFLDQIGGCCRAGLVGQGSACMTPVGPGSCNAISNCQPGGQPELGRAGAYIEVLSDHPGQPRVESWQTETGTVIRVEEVWDTVPLDAVPDDYNAVGWARLQPTTGDPHVAVARLRAAVNGVDGLLMRHERHGSSSLFLHESFLGVPVATVDRVVAVVRPTDELSFLSGRGETIPSGGAMLVTCSDAVPAGITLSPSRTDVTSELRCQRHEGYLEVIGTGLYGAFLPGPARDVRPPGRMGASTNALYTQALDFPPGPRGGIGRCIPGQTRTCGCGTRFQMCVGGAWGPCRPGFELCNGCDDDLDGSVDENGSDLCSDFVNCTLDVCTRMAGCQHVPRTTYCMRGTCTRGVCAGAASATSLVLDPRTRPPADANACSYDESDARCEQLDGCHCNGIARCNGTLGPSWDGISVPNLPSDPIRTSTASCAQRAPLSPRFPPNDARYAVRLCSSQPDCAAGEQCVAGQCYPVRNGGCETSGNACTVDDLCIEPDPGTSTCTLYNTVPGLRAVHQAVLDLVTERTTTIDGLSVACVADLLGQDMPAPPFHLWCQNDGSPCTVPFNTPGNTAGMGCAVLPPSGSGSAPLITCLPEVPVANGVDVLVGHADDVGTTWSGTGFSTTQGAICQGDPLADISGRRSCYHEACDGAGNCASFSDDNACTADRVGGGECGAPFVCTGSAGIQGPNGVVVAPSLWGLTHGSFVGCRRQECLVEEADTAGCFPAGLVGDCRVCDPALSDSTLSPLNGAVCAGIGGNELPCGRCMDGTCEPTGNPTCQ